ncbi:helix-turn-helix domain-containing protein [Nocardioides zeae]|uniref:Helix-turn-helix domain-containing protein n=1 Tax=Nocardioides imazamoxiresistens TaxID=3231893 RepID=A0ABU3PSN6_9ACTN|nr:helix-turn-helix domain-containing protein [Nocardioides zeae]MDT9592198.1 helix-turn-helix domain-containing protein [Nocardioides zeae]
MQLDVSTIRRRREEFLGSGGSVTRLEGVRPEIVASWRRSMAYGLDPSGSRPAFTDETTGEQLIAAMSDVLERRRHHLADISASLTLTDHRGRILVRYVEDSGFQRRLDAHDVLPGFSFAEASIGTNSGALVLETGTSALVAGPEHFFEESLELTCAGVPVRHPSTRRIVATLNLTCRFEHTSPLLLAWVSDLALQVEANLTQRMSRTEQALLGAYQQANHDTRLGLVCLDERTIVSNATAARMLAPPDHTVLWESVSEAVSSRAGFGSVRLTLANGDLVAATAEPVHDAGRVVGALVRLRPDGDTRRRAATLASTAPPVELPGVTGRSDAWATMRRSLAAAGDEPTVLTGEPGVGKHAVARAWLAARTGGDDDPVVVATVDVAAAPADVLVSIDRAIAAGARGVVVQHLDQVPGRDAPALARGLRRVADAGIAVVGTCTDHELDPAPAGTALDWARRTVRVPSLAERPEDVAPLLEDLTWRQVGGLRRQRWTAAATQVVARSAWPGNIRGLESLVRQVVSGPEQTRVTPEHLPSRLRARAARRQLTGLERIEAQAVLEALASAGGNKRAAADLLGIARSTLYRKVRALGVDLDGQTF